MLASLLGCVFTENTRKKKLQSSSSNLKDLCPADDTCITNGRDRFISSKY